MATGCLPFQLLDDDCKSLNAELIKSFDMEIEGNDCKPHSVRGLLTFFEWRIRGPLLHVEERWTRKSEEGN
jgi:hypothetical protein